MKKNCSRHNQEQLRIEKIIKIRRKKLYLKWKGYDNWP